MDFNAYKELEQKLAPYRGLYENHPLTMLLLDKPLRAMLIGIPHEKYVKKLFAKASLGIRIKQLVQRFAAYMVPHGACVAFMLNRFPLVHGHLQRYCDEAGWALKESKHAPALSILAGKKLILEETLASSADYLPLKTLIDKKGLLYALNQPAALDRAERLLEKEVDSLASLLRALKVKLIFAQGHQVKKALLAVAARKAGCRFGAVTHGYVQDRTLFTIFPLHDADFLLAWTQEQKRDLAGADERFAERIHCIGFPKPTVVSRAASSTSARKIGFICEPIRNRFSASAELDFFFIDVLKQVHGLARQHGFQLEIKLHPKDRRDEEILQTLAASGLSLIETLKPAVYPDYELFLGSNSSLLVETALAGIPTFQLLELKKCDFEAVVQPIALAQLGNLLAHPQALAAAPESREMQYEDFRDFINQQLAA